MNELKRFFRAAYFLVNGTFEGCPEIHAANAVSSALDLLSGAQPSERANFLHAWVDLLDRRGVAYLTH